MYARPGGAMPRPISVKKKKGRSKSPKGKKKGKKSRKMGIRSIAGDLAADEALELRTLRADRVDNIKERKGAEERAQAYEKQLDQMRKDEEDIFENLRSKVQKSKDYAKVLLDQRDVLEREKKDAVENLEARLAKQTKIARDSKQKYKSLQALRREEEEKMRLWRGVRG